MRVYWIRVGPNPMMYPYRKKKFIHRYTEKMLCDDRETNPQTPRIASYCQKLGKRHGRDSPAEPPEGVNHAITLISNCWLPELRKH